MANTESVSHDDLVVCACGGQDYTARDAIQAALYRGELDPLWREFLHRMAAEKQADMTEMDLDEEAIDSAAEQFRYHHDLITAEETEQWLVIRGLSLDDFSDYFVRQYCSHALGAKVTAEEMDYLSAPEELRQHFAAELVLSGDLDWMINKLTWRLAAAAAAKAGKEEVETAAMEKERALFFKRSDLEAEKLPGWMEKMGHDSRWFEQIVRMEAVFQGRRATLVTPQTRQRELGRLRMPLTRYEAEVIELESRDAAQEALFCVRQDGMSMEDVATEGRYPYRSIAFLQEAIPDDLQQRFLSVTAGEVLEPFPHGDGFELYRITNKVEPQADDPAVQERVENIILTRHFSELAGRHVDLRLRRVAAPE
jgi:hypothetical protein